MSETEKPEEPLTFDRVKKTLEYFRKVDQQITETVDGLARKMEIDPERDILFIPERWVLGWYGHAILLPRWIKVMKYGRQGYVLRNCKGR